MSRSIVSGTPRLVCALTLLLVCLQAFPQTALYRIAGTVLNAATGEPVPRVTVAVLSASDHQPVALVVTGNDGRFAVEGLAAAKYELTASSPPSTTSMKETTTPPSSPARASRQKTSSSG
jgi:hypothetical protein